MKISYGIVIPLPPAKYQLKVNIGNRSSLNKSQILPDIDFERISILLTTWEIFTYTANLLFAISSPNPHPHYPAASIFPANLLAVALAG